MSTFSSGPVTLTYCRTKHSAGDELTLLLSLCLSYTQYTPTQYAHPHQPHTHTHTHTRTPTFRKVRCDEQLFQLVLWGSTREGDRTITTACWCVRLLTLASAAILREDWER